MSDTIRVGTRVQIIGTGQLGTVEIAEDDGRCYVREESGYRDWHSDSRLAPFREVATTAGDETPEQRWREAMAAEAEQLAARVTHIEQQLGERWLEALGSHEQQQQPRPLPGAISRWLEMPSWHRVVDWLRGDTADEDVPTIGAMARTAEALVAVPIVARQLAEADREIEGLRVRQQRLEGERVAVVAALADGQGGDLIELARRRAQELQALKVLHRVTAAACPPPGGAIRGYPVGEIRAALRALDDLGASEEPEPDEPAPEPSDAGLTALQLAERVEELEPYRRLYERLSAPEAYDVESPEALAAVALGARTELAQLVAEDTAAQQLASEVDEQQLETMADLIDATATGGIWAELALFCRRMAAAGEPAAPTRPAEPHQLTECLTPEQLQRLAGGLRALVGSGAGAGTALVVLADYLEQLAGGPQLEPQPEKPPCSAATGVRRRYGGQGVPQPTTEQEAPAGPPMEPERGPVPSAK